MLLDNDATDKIDEPPLKNIKPESIRFDSISKQSIFLNKRLIIYFVWWQSVSIQFLPNDRKRALKFVLNIQFASQLISIDNSCSFFSICSNENYIFRRSESCNSVPGTSLWQSYNNYAKFNEVNM